jgi:hypothetical protein
LLQRKKVPNWELDAWSEQTKTADFGPPDEAVIICVDTSSSMNLAMSSGWVPRQNGLGANPTRLTEVKEFFKNLALRISALNLSTHLGLVTFSHRTSVEIKQALTPLHLKFNNQLDDISTKGTQTTFIITLDPVEWDAVFCTLKTMKSSGVRVRLELALVENRILDQANV